ncbi:MarR family winged helix-turn-helix transcriptional regulator [Streptomonospora nanhaiensis]|uniref:DNA-binding MarR family transcriptional regulator n=1 Tax=Streptomonospora nanhaiensis TaxID=1323731 RepID=A0A853BHR2_9ACTN|nr:MarR family transcriptional regulator [Streptomonospora nanhaiensis]MBV2366486.1 MarR family transcriptional regulator [Streptomonospora nanhaiensis]NYI94264.1 DNA-binding MarR family transcriptional regulator [Streptomonospora nanhaiensis]
MTAVTDSPGHTESTPYLLIRLASTVDQLFADTARTHGLTAQQAHLICRLVGGPVQMAALGRQLGLEKSGLSGLVDRVERHGLVERVRDSCDRRMWWVRLTGQGQKTAHATHEEVMAGLEALTADLGPAEADLLKAVLERLLTDAPGDAAR